MINVNDDDKDHKRRVIKWLAVGSAVFICVLLGIVYVSGLLDNHETEDKKVTLNQSDIDNAKTFASDFITKAGTFGVTDETITVGDFDFTAGIVTKNLGEYNNKILGVSRSEMYKKLEDDFDVNSGVDFSEEHINNLKSYYPDWSGQLVSYRVKDTTVVNDQPYSRDDVVYLPVTVNFTSTVRVFTKKDDGSWSESADNKPETVKLVLSQQQNSSWKVWSVSDAENDPYVLSTWDEPDWKVSSP